VDGGRTIQRFLQDGLIDEITISRIPILIGEGIPLFGVLSSDIKLKHVETASFDSGLVQSTYRVGE
jgi:dihydrofolate reductase